MRLLGEVLQLSIAHLQEKQVQNARRCAEMLLSHILRFSRMDLYLQFDLPLEEDELSLFRQGIRRLRRHEPVEYIIGYVNFYGCVIEVTPDVLIPRVETEVLVDHVVTSLCQENLENKNLLDLCAGSGCIGLGMKKRYPALHVVLADHSEKAWQVCRRNAEKNALDVECVLGDMLSPVLYQKFDYVICNPPYISFEEHGRLQPSVRAYEPENALVGGERGWEMYQRIAQELPRCLSPGAKVFLEIGCAQGEDVKRIFQLPPWRKGYLRQDYAGYDRFFFLEIE